MSISAEIYVFASLNFAKFLFCEIADLVDMIQLCRPTCQAKKLKTKKAANIDHSILFGKKPKLMDVVHFDAPYIKTFT